METKRKTKRVPKATPRVTPSFGVGILDGLCKGNQKEPRNPCWGSPEKHIHLGANPMADEDQLSLDGLNQISLRDALQKLVLTDLASLSYHDQSHPPKSSVKGKQPGFLTLIPLETVKIVTPGESRVVLGMWRKGPEETTRDSWDDFHIPARRGSRKLGCFFKLGGWFSFWDANFGEPTFGGSSFLPSC